MLKKILMAVAITAISNTYAVSEDECAIWLCAPAGFRDSACNAAHRAMHYRVHKNLPPLPPFKACDDKSNNTPSTVTSAEGIAAYIPAHQERDQCIKYTIAYGSTGKIQQCQEWSYKNIPASYVKGTPCVHGPYGTTNPKGCVSTQHYIEVYDNGTQLGDTYYY